MALSIVRSLCVRESERVCGTVYCTVSVCERETERVWPCLLYISVLHAACPCHQNLEAYKDENKERYAGPVLIGAGVLVLARGAFSRLRPQRAPSGRRRSFLQRYVREVYNRPILAVSTAPSFLTSLNKSSTSCQTADRTHLPFIKATFILSLS